MSSSLFGGDDKNFQQTFKEKVDVQSKSILAVISRLKDSENSLDIMSEKIEMLDHNAVANFKKISNDIKSLRQDIRDINEHIAEIKEFNQRMSKQIKLMATNDEVIKLEKYIDLWDPMQFVTKEELEASQKKFIEGLKKVIEDFLEDDEKK